jgi:hypothetical protein
LKTPYRDYRVLDKWDGPSFDDATRSALGRRLHAVPPRRFLDEAQWQALNAVVARLIPQPDPDTPVPIVPWIDDLLLADRGEGFRQDGMPPLREAWRRGLAAIDAQARLCHGSDFASLDEARQDALLHAIQQGDVDTGAWGGLPAARFFGDILLKTVAGIYYAHPDAWSEIGFGGPASPRGYVRLGFDDSDPWEAREVP